MSIIKSYFNKNNTIVAKSLVNSGKNPVTELFYGDKPLRGCKWTGTPSDVCGGRTGHTSDNSGRFSRLIFDLNLDDTINKVNSGCINLSGGTGTTHTLKMTNTSSFDTNLLNDKLVNGKRRASSFSLFLWRVSGTSWDEGVGYDVKRAPGIFEPEFDEPYSQRPSNWYSATTLTPWPTQGIYDNTNSGTYTLIDTQNFGDGNENINFNMTDEINNRLTGATPHTGITYGVSFTSTLENLTGLSESYSVGFFTRHTQTFYEPYLETQYDDYIGDSRNQFYLNKTNRLFLYTNTGGIPTNLDVLPQVTIYDCDSSVYSSMTATNLTCGVYYIDLLISGDTYGTPSQFTDQWSNLIVNGNSLDTITNEFTVLSADDYYQIGPMDQTPKDFGYSIDGIKLDEKITAGDTRKVFVSVRVPYTVNRHVVVDNIKYRIYVTQGTTEVTTHPWANVNRTYNHNYFLLNTGDMIPNEYYIDVEVTSNQKVNIYKRITKFQITNQT